MRDLDLALLGMARLTGLSLAELSALPVPRLATLLRTLNRIREKP